MGDPLRDMVGEIDAEKLPHPQMRAMYLYWLSACEGDAAPPVAALDPLKLPRRALPHMGVLEVEGDPPRFRARLVGTELVSATGEDITGQIVDDLPGIAPQLVRFRWAVEHKRPYFVSSPLTWSDRDFIRYDALGLPFLDDEGRVVRLVFVFGFS